MDGKGNGKVRNKGKGADDKGNGKLLNVCGNRRRQLEDEGAGSCGAAGEGGSAERPQRMSDMTYALERKFRARAEFDGPGSDL